MHFYQLFGEHFRYRTGTNIFQEAIYIVLPSAGLGPWYGGGQSHTKVIPGKLEERHLQ